MKMQCGFLLAGILFLLVGGPASAEYTCGVFASGGAGNAYKTCDACLQNNRRCEQRCEETGFLCTAVGYDRNGFRETVEGVLTTRKKKAKKKAVQKCREQGLNGCSAEQCREEVKIELGSVEKCRKIPAQTYEPSMEYRCGIFSASNKKTPKREYKDCNDCLKRHKRCEERCAQPGYICTAVGYDRYGFREVIEGPFAQKKKRARRKAIRQCKENGLNGCGAESCKEEMQFDPNSFKACNDTKPKEKEKQKKKKAERNRPKPKTMHLPLPTVVPPLQPTVPVAKKYVVSWKHIKDKCHGQPYHKISQQCGNRVNFWHGIYCQVTWSDGKVSNLHGKVDQVDPYGRAYCTRGTRPAYFNCVNSCDYNNGPLVKLPQP
ncbi:MAG: hypothetical protein D3923_01580 [Candidatus Electrothrix sp. AR3]|nr:hypothetical protein [Candidatus Electrothrix sp. AR3]